MSWEPVRWDKDALYASLVGNTVKAVQDHGESSVVLVLEDGRRVRFDLEGDCCSRSFYTDPHQFDDLVGDKITRIEERAGASTEKGKNDDSNDDCVRWHFLLIDTAWRSITIDWRNESNGYYDGEIVPHLWVESA